MKQNMKISKEMRKYMKKDLINRINQSKIIYQTLGDVTTAPNNK